jgi:hypothetical protein
MAIFNQQRAKSQTNLDRAASRASHWVVTPFQALIAGAAVCLCCAWCFAVVFFGWPRDWAKVPFLISIYLAPALTIVSFRELWRSGWNGRTFYAAVSSLAGFALLCAFAWLSIRSWAFPN